MVYLHLNGPLGTSKVDGPRALYHYVSKLRPACPAVGQIQLHLSLRGGWGWPDDDSGRANLDFRSSSFFLASIGAVSVFKAVYVDRRDLKCACVGGDSNVPLGFVSLTENLMMVGMAIWMITKT